MADIIEMKNGFFTKLVKFSEGEELVKVYNLLSNSNKDHYTYLGLTTKRIVSLNCNVEKNVVSKSKFELPIENYAGITSSVQRSSKIPTLAWGTVLIVLAAIAIALAFYFSIPWLNYVAYPIAAVLTIIAFILIFMPRKKAFYLKFYSKNVSGSFIELHTTIKKNEFLEDNGDLIINIPTTFTDISYECMQMTHEIGALCQDILMNGIKAKEKYLTKAEQFVYGQNQKRHEIERKKQDENELERLKKMQAREKKDALKLKGISILDIDNEK